MNNYRRLTLNEAIVLHNSRITELENAIKTFGDRDENFKKDCQHQLELHKKFIDELELIRESLIKTINTDSI